MYLKGFADIFLLNVHFEIEKNEVFVRLQKIAFHSISKEMLGILLQL